MEGNLICSSLHFISGVEAKRTCVYILLQYYRDGYYRAPNYTPFRFILKDIPGFAEGARIRNVWHVCPFCSGTLIHRIGAHNIYVSATAKMCDYSIISPFQKVLATFLIRVPGKSY